MERPATCSVVPPRDAVILGLDPRIYCPPPDVAFFPTHPQPSADPRVKPEDDVHS
jgi:hypothetical protein